MIFATDLDGCLLNPWAVFLDWFSKNLQQDFRYEDIWTYDFQWNFGCSKKVINRMWQEIWDYHYPAYNNAAEFIKTLKSMGYTVVCISSRGSEVAKNAALRDINANSLDFDDVILMDVQKQPKSDFVNSLPECQFFLEDSIPNVVDCAENCPSTIPLLLNRPWNAMSLDTSTYVRIFSYKDALELATKT